MLTYRMTVEMKPVSQKRLAVKKSGVFPNLHNDKVNPKAGLLTAGRQSCPGKRKILLV